MSGFGVQIVELVEQLERRRDIDEGLVDEGAGRRVLRIAVDDALEKLRRMARALGRPLPPGPTKARCRCSHRGQVHMNQRADGKTACLARGCTCERFEAAS